MHAALTLPERPSPLERSHPQAFSALGSRPKRVGSRRFTGGAPRPAAASDGMRRNRSAV